MYDTVTVIADSSGSPAFRVEHGRWALGMLSSVGCAALVLMTAVSLQAQVPVQRQALRARAQIWSATNIPSIYEFQVFNDATFARTVFINEWMMQNSVAVDPKDGDYESWFELFNESNQTVEVSGELPALQR